VGFPHFYSTALGLFGTRWPDVVVACVVAGFALQGAPVVVRQASRELRIGHHAIRMPV
jgi:hypothetical protein